MTDPTPPLALYVPRAVLISVVPVLSLAVVIGLLFPSLSATMEGVGILRPEAIVLDLIGYVVLSPLLETLIMVAVFAGARRLGARLPMQVGVQVALWALLHGLVAPVWGVGLAWSFLVFSVVYLAQERRSRRRAYWVAASVHASQNAIACALQLASAAT